MATRIGISNAKFTYNDVPTFMLMHTYFDAINARQTDLPIFKARGINALRLMLAWPLPSYAAGAIFNSDGSLKATEKATLLAFIQAADALGIVCELVILHDSVDAFLTTGGARTAAIENACTYFGGEPNVMFDVCNELDIASGTWLPTFASWDAILDTAHANTSAICYVSVAPSLVEADGPFMHDTTDVVDTSFLTSWMNTSTDLCVPHFKGNAQWWWSKGRRVENMRTWLDANGHSSKPLFMNEDNRWGTGYGDAGAGDIPADRYLSTMLASVRYGAAGWTFHSDTSFDLSVAGTYPTLFSEDTEREIFDRLGRTLEERGVLTPFNLVDGFNRANEGPPISLNWVTVSGNGQKVISNQAGNNAGSTTANDLDVWGAYLYKNQRIRAQLAVVPRSGQVEYAILALRVESLHVGYDQLIEVEIDNITSWRTRLYVVSGGYTQLESTYTGTINANDYIELRAVDGTITVLVNDVAVITALGAQFIAPGYAGVASFHDSGTSAVRWNDVQVGAIYSPKLTLARTAVR